MSNAAILGVIYDFAVPRVVNGVENSMTIYQKGVLPVIGRILYCPDFMVSANSTWTILETVLFPS